MSTVVETREEVAERIRQLGPQLQARGIRRVALFGSFARETQRADSDIDLLVEFAPGQKSYDNFFTACELLEGAMGRRVEVVTPESLSPHIGPRILQEAEDVVAD